MSESFLGYDEDLDHKRKRGRPTDRARGIYYEVREAIPLRTVAEASLLYLQGYVNRDGELLTDSPYRYDRQAIVRSIFSIPRLRWVDTDHPIASNSLISEIRDFARHHIVLFDYVSYRRTRELRGEPSKELYAPHLISDTFLSFYNYALGFVRRVTQADISPERESQLFDQNPSVVIATLRELSIRRVVDLRQTNPDLLYPVARDQVVVAQGRSTRRNEPGTVGKLRSDDSRVSFATTWGEVQVGLIRLESGAVSTRVAEAWQVNERQPRRRLTVLQTGELEVAPVSA